MKKLPYCSDHFCSGKKTTIFVKVLLLLPLSAEQVQIAKQVLQLAVQKSLAIKFGVSLKDITTKLFLGPLLLQRQALRDVTLMADLTIRVAIEESAAMFTQIVKESTEPFNDIDFKLNLASELQTTFPGISVSIKVLSASLDPTSAPVYPVAGSAGLSITTLALIITGSLVGSVALIATLIYARLSTRRKSANILTSSTTICIDLDAVYERVHCMSPQLDSLQQSFSQLPVASNIMLPSVRRNNKPVEFYNAIFEYEFEATSAVAYGCDINGELNAVKALNDHVMEVDTTEQPTNMSQLIINTSFDVLEIETMQQSRSAQIKHKHYNDFSEA